MNKPVEPSDPISDTGNSGTKKDNGNEPQKHEFSWEEKIIVGDILNEWYEWQITREEADRQLREKLPQYNMRTVFYEAGNDAKAREEWNSYGTDYLKSNLLISDRCGSYFIVGK